VGLSLVLLGASALVYGIHYLIFHDLSHILLYFTSDFAFLFISVLFVTLMIERILSRREKLSLLHKLNMVIGTFFSDIGIDLLNRLPRYVENTGDLSPRLVFSARWTKKEFLKAIAVSKAFPYKVRVSPESLREMRTLLDGHREFLLRLLENPNLLEHEGFTDLLWAVFHLTEELDLRCGDLENLPAADYAHLAGDVKRAFSQISGEWLAYAMHLKASYPFLFSLAARINPFGQDPSPIVREP
jgi:hypothetical protein